MLTRASLTIRLHPDDDVVIARQQLVGGTQLLDEKRHRRRASSRRATRSRRAPSRRASRCAATTRSSASRAAPIAPGEHVHLHNLAMGDVRARLRVRRRREADAVRRRRRRRSWASCARRRPRRDAQLHRHPVHRELLGDRRARRSPTTSRGERLARDFPNVDGVVALTHGSGCGMDTHGEGMQILRRTLGGYARHAELRGRAGRRPGLRGEPDQRAARRAEPDARAPLLRTFNIQDTGGTRQDDRARHRADRARCCRTPTT